MDASSAAELSPRTPRVRRVPSHAASFRPHTRARLICALSALLLMLLAGGGLIFISAGSQATDALAATCPISNLPPTPTSGSPLNPSTIKLNEILTNPQKKDWNCDGKIDAADQWIELVNTSGVDESLFGLQLGSQGHTILLNSTDRIGAHSYQEGAEDPRL